MPKFDPIKLTFEELTLIEFLFTEVLFPPAVALIESKTYYVCVAGNWRNHVKAPVSNGITAISSITGHPVSVRKAITQLFELAEKENVPRFTASHNVVESIRKKL